MFNTIKLFHKIADLAKAKIDEAKAEIAQAERHIEALKPALDDVEQAAYTAFLQTREKLEKALPGAIKS